METPSSDQKRCPFCGETIMAVAVKCQYCGSFPVSQKDFWKNTWEAWRSGVLSDIAEHYQEIASAQFEKFMKSCPEIRLTATYCFTRDCSILNDEFLISYGHNAGIPRMPAFVLTNKRIAIYNKRKGWLSVDLSEVREYKISWRGKIELTKRNGEILLLEKLDSVPTDNHFKKAIELATTTIPAVEKAEPLIKPEMVPGSSKALMLKKNKITSAWALLFAEVAGTIIFFVFMVVVMTNRLTINGVIGIFAVMSVVFLIGGACGAIFGHFQKDLPVHNRRKKNFASIIFGFIILFILMAILSLFGIK